MSRAHTPEARCNARVVSLFFLCGDSSSRLPNRRSDASGLQAIGSYLLWKIEGPAGARLYLEAAAVGGSFEAILDLLVVSLFEASRLSCDAAVAARDRLAS